MHYTGKWDDGTVFDSSHTRKQPFRFKQGSGQVIGCWDRAALEPAMKKGSLASIKCPASLAYGANGNTGTNDRNILPNETIYFDIEVIEFRP